MPALPVQTCGVGVSRNMYFMSYNKIVHFFYQIFAFFYQKFWRKFAVGKTTAERRVLTHGADGI